MSWTSTTEPSPSDDDYTKSEEQALDKFERTYEWQIPTAGGARNPDQHELETVAVEDLKLKPQDFDLSPGDQTRTATTEGHIQQGLNSWTVTDEPE